MPAFRLRPVLLLPLLALPLLLSACATVPMTGRSQLMIGSREQHRLIMDQTFSKMKAEMRAQNSIVPENTSGAEGWLYNATMRAAARLTPLVVLPGVSEWEILVVRGKEPNAFVLDNGKIVVLTGILQVIRTEGELAAVIGHEISHALAGHGLERDSQRALASIARTAMTAAVISQPAGSSSAVTNARLLDQVNPALQYGFLLPYSRTHESEADQMGQVLMAKAGYDPSCASELWVRWSALSTNTTPEYARTHPGDEGRARALEGWKPLAMLYFANKSLPLPNSLEEMARTLAQTRARYAGSPVAQMPARPVGYWETFRVAERNATYTHRVEGTVPCVPGECLRLSSTTGKEFLFTKGQALAEVRGRNGTWTRFEPPAAFARYPYKVGDSFQDEYTLRFSNGKNRTMRGRTYVVGYDTVSVPAGTFQAFHLVHSANGERAWEDWFAPEAGTSVRTLHYDRKGWSQPKERLEELIESSTVPSKPAPEQANTN